MASRAFLIMTIVAAIAAPALATDYMVGDESGWKLGYNYTEWAKGKEFHVGDTLMFMYKEGDHNVLKVNGDDFKNCTTSNAIGDPLKTGNDTIVLAKPGKKWYICGVGYHCSGGMKLVITVSAEGPSPSPTPGNSAAVDVAPVKAWALMLALVAAYRMIMT